MLLEIIKIESEVVEFAKKHLILFILPIQMSIKDEKPPFQKKTYQSIFFLDIVHIAEATKFYS